MIKFFHLKIQKLNTYYVLGSVHRYIYAYIEVAFYDYLFHICEVE